MIDRLKNTRTVILSLFLLLPLTSAFGQTGISVGGGAGAEVNIITLEDEGFAIGGVLAMEYRFGPVFASGVRISGAFDGKELLSLESRIFARWYVLRFRALELFLQGDLGLIATIRDLEVRDSRGTPNIGAALGIRVLLPRQWYVEPYIRGGYPFIAGAGIMIGFRPEVNSSSASTTSTTSRNSAELQAGESMIVRRDIRTIPEIAHASIEPAIYFSGNAADFYGLDEGTIRNNYLLLRGLATFMKDNPDYYLVIEGHANPVTNTPQEESSVLNTLSTERAETVSRILISYGIDRKRLVIARAGGNKVQIPREDRNHWNLNRRVDFTLMRYVSTDE